MNYSKLYFCLVLLILDLPVRFGRVQIILEGSIYFSGPVQKRFILVQNDLDLYKNKALVLSFDEIIDGILSRKPSIIKIPLLHLYIFHIS